MAHAEKDAQQLLGTVWTAPDSSDFRLPVDPFYIAKKLGIQVYLDPDLEDDVSGMLVKRGAGYDPQILLNAYDSRNRQRFTCAHELGHYNKRAGDDTELKYVDRRDFLSSAGNDPEEVYANQFAAALLMPAKIVKKHAKDAEVTALAYRFGVSADAMTFRLKNLELPV